MADEHRQNSDQILPGEFWTLVADCTDRLISSWNTLNDPPCLGNFLEAVPATTRRPLLWELIKVDLEIRWNEKNTPTTLEEYVHMYPLLGSVDDLPADLIFEEYQIRQGAGNRSSIESLSERFPLQRKAIESISMKLDPTIAFSGDTHHGGRYIKRENQSGGFHRPEMYNEGESVGEFKLLLLLGAGSFARVFLARQLSLDRLVALKISANEGHEPRTLAQLEHPNIVRVYDQRNPDDHALRLLYMELVPGGSLDDAVKGLVKKELSSSNLFDWIDANLQRVGAAPPMNSDWRTQLLHLDWPYVVCHYGIQIALGLDHAHDHGILHRDIKPANVLLTAEGVPKLADFNISFNSADGCESPGDAFGGSLAYMSPEQLCACHTALGGHVSEVREASDIYSVGLVLIELLSGKRVFSKPSQGTDWEVSLRKMLKDRELLDRQPATDLFASDCPESVREVIMQCVSHKPENRPASAITLANQLKVCLNPRLWNLLRQPESPVGRIINTFPLVFLLLATLIPMAPIAVFNFTYNRNALTNHFPEFVARFDQVQWWINLTGFPLGILLGIYLGVRAVYFSARQTGSRHTMPLLQLGRDLAVLSMFFWFISGIIFPILLHYSITANSDALLFTLFLLSLTLCGLIAGTYPFLLVTLCCVRYLMPRRLREGEQYPPVNGIQRTRSTLRMFVALTAIVPMLATLLAVMFRNQQQSTLVVLSIVGIIGFILALCIAKVVDGDLSALAKHAKANPQSK
jgi:serine/threonine protein kinase